MQKLIKHSMPNLEVTFQISLSVNTIGLMDLPAFDESKRLTCPPNTSISDLINFLSKTLNFEKQFVVLSH